MFGVVHNLPIFTHLVTFTTGYSLGRGMWLSHGRGGGRSGSTVLQGGVCGKCMGSGASRVDLPRLISAWWWGTATGYSPLASE